MQKHSKPRFTQRSLIQSMLLVGAVLFCGPMFTELRGQEGQVQPQEVDGPPARPPASTERRPAKEDTYTITSVLQVLKPVDPNDMNDDFQEARVIEQDDDSCTVQVTYYPLYNPNVGENPNWRKDYAGMTEYLQPTPTENWDEPMRRQLVAQLRQDGIDPDVLTDKQLVEQVSRWAKKRATSTRAFSIWAVYFPEGKPTVYPPLREAFDRQKPEEAWTDQQMFDQEVLGRSMFSNKVHGSCTSYSVYLATILRALGIPTRIVFCIPPFDPNDDAQAQRFYENTHHNKVRETVRGTMAGLSGFANHLFNEVYVGNRWVRLNYTRLGQPVLDKHCFGLMTHVYTCSSLSRAALHKTWGMRWFKYPADGQPKLSSINPYRLVSIKDHFGADAHVENPPVAIAELRTVTIVALLPPDSPHLPQWAREDLTEKNASEDLFLSCKEWISGSYRQMRAFSGRVGREFRLTAPPHPEIAVKLSGLTLSSGDGRFQAYGVRIHSQDRAKLVPGVAYQIKPLNTSDTYRWTVAPDLTPITFGPPDDNAESKRPFQ